MSDIVTWEGVLTATSSIIHTGQSLGTVKYLRREKFLTPDGVEHVEYPVISGNSLRGVLRDHSAELLWEDLGKPKLTLPTIHALWSGGALVKAKTEPLSGQKLAELKRVAPHVGLFGAAGGGRIINGCLTVNKLVPLCSELAHLLPSWVTGEPLPSINDMLQIEYATRVSEHTTSGRSDLVEETGDAAVDNSMRYGYETFITGSRFHIKLRLINASDSEKAFMQRVIDDYAENGNVGARKSVGHGEVSIKWVTSPQNLPVWVQPAPVVDTVNCLRWLS